MYYGNINQKDDILELMAKSTYIPVLLNADSLAPCGSVVVLLSGYLALVSSCHILQWIHPGLTMLQLILPSDWLLAYL